jgi:hypothetical protein
MYQEPPGWLTFRVPTMPDQSMDSECCFYNRDKPGQPHCYGLRGTRYPLNYWQAVSA